MHHPHNLGTTGQHRGFFFHEPTTWQQVGPYSYCQFHLGRWCRHWDVGSVQHDSRRAFLLGVLAGLTSVFGYVYGSPFLECKVFGIHDTCGVHALHGLSSVLGGLASIVFVVVDSNASFLSDEKSVSQLCLSQFMAVLFTLFVATVSGLLTGHAMVFSGTIRRQSTDGSGDGRRPSAYDDRLYWESGYFSAAGGQGED